MSGRSARLLDHGARQQLIRAVFACGTWPELRALEREIAATWAATPAQRAANDAELQWVRAAARARREMVGRGRNAHETEVSAAKGARGQR